MKTRAQEYSWATNAGFSVGTYAAAFSMGGVPTARARSLTLDVRECLAELNVDIEPPAISKRPHSADSVDEASIALKVFLRRVASVIEQKADARAAELFELMATFGTFSILGNPSSEILHELNERIERIGLPFAEAKSFVTYLSEPGNDRGNREYVGKFLMWTLSHVDHLATRARSHGDIIDELIEVKPGIFGVSIRVNVLARRVARWFAERKRHKSG